MSFSIIDQQKIPKKKIFVVLLCKKSLEDFVCKLIIKDETNKVNGYGIALLGLEVIAIKETFVKCSFKTDVKPEKDILIIAKDLVPLWNDLFGHYAIPLP